MCSPLEKEAIRREIFYTADEKIKKIKNQEVENLKIKIQDILHDPSQINPFIQLAKAHIEEDKKTKPSTSDDVADRAAWEIIKPSYEKIGERIKALADEVFFAPLRDGFIGKTYLKVAPNDVYLRTLSPIRDDLRKKLQPYAPPSRSWCTLL